MLPDPPPSERVDGDRVAAGALDGETLTVEYVDGIATIWMDRPAKLNAMSQTFFRELTDVVAAIDACPDIAVAVLTGRGEAFSAGADIASFEVLTDIAATRGSVAPRARPGSAMA